MIENMAISSIFNSSGDPRRSVSSSEAEKLSLLIESQGIKASKIPMGDISIIKAIIEHYNRIEAQQAANPTVAFDEWQIFAPFSCLDGIRHMGGGYLHRVLGLIAGAYLRDCGFEIIYEVWCNGRVVDVASNDRKWLIECGDTSPCPIEDHLLYTSDYFHVLPFQRIGHNMFMVRFERDVKWDSATVMCRNPVDNYSRKLQEAMGIT